MDPEKDAIMAIPYANATSGRATLSISPMDILVYEYTTDSLTPNDFEAAQIAAQADYTARILAALQVKP